MEERIQSIKDLQIETAFNYDVESQGRIQAIEYVNKTLHELELPAMSEELCVLYTDSECLHRATTQSVDYVGVIIDKDCVVKRIVSNRMDIESCTKAQLTLESGCACIMAIASNECIENTKGSMKLEFFINNFHSGEIVKLRYQNIHLSLEEVIALCCEDNSQPVMILEGTDMFTTTKNQIPMVGKILHTKENLEYVVEVIARDDKNQIFSSTEKTLEQNEGTCSFQVQQVLKHGVNYMDVVLYEEGQKILTKTRIVYQRIETTCNQQNHSSCGEKQVIMWVEQYVSANQLNTKERIKQLVATAKDAGVTAFALDVKGCEGYVAYKKATRTKALYLTCTKNPKKQIEMEIDLLEELIEVAHANGLRVYTSFNFFVEGNLHTNDFAIDLPNTHRDWAEVLQAPEDGGQLRSVFDSKRNSMLCYVNPANDEVVAFELLRVQEVLENYEIDGVILDRTRYDNQFADFSDVSKEKFQAFLKKQGKELKNWPQDCYTFDEGGRMVYGPLHLEWFTFRSSVIKEFSKKVHELIVKHNQMTGEHVVLAAYVGSWYELYYQNGVNWSDTSFLYNERLGFPMEELYGERYGSTSYLEYLEFLMIGCYYKTKEQIQKYLTLGNIVTDGKVPLIGSISLPDLNTQKLQRTGTQACLEASDGCMIFDLCYNNWEWTKSAISKDLVKQSSK